MGLETHGVVCEDINEWVDRLIVYSMTTAMNDSTGPWWGVDGYECVGQQARGLMHEYMNE